MRTVKRNPFLSGVCAILGGAFLWAGSAAAEVASDQAAGIIVFPKLVVDTSAGVDTEIQLSNTSTSAVNVRCFYVNANSHCSNEPATLCATNDDCGGAASGGICTPGWNETDFRFRLTALQPIVWQVSRGMAFFPLQGPTGDPADCADTPCVGVNGEFNVDSAIPAVAEDPFQGELKCIEVGDDESPNDRNDLKGEATIVKSTGTQLDARAYNGIGIQAVTGANDGDNTLVLGVEYSSCPNILILDHFFDDAIEPISDALVRTDLTLIPCSEDFVLQDTALFNTTVQFLVFNEFEQRFSTSTSLRCFREIALSDIDTRPRSLTDADPSTTGDYRSIFNVNVQGTLTGQTRIRAVDDGSTSHGNGILGVAEEFHRTSSTNLDTVRASAAFNIDQVGVRTSSDFIQMP